MALLATEKQGYSNTFKKTLWNDQAYNFNEVVVNDSAATLAIGTVLGKVTATGKYKVSVQTAVDGSQVPAAVVAVEKAVAAATDTGVVAMTRGPASVNKGGLILAASFDNDAKKLAAYAALEAIGIQVLNAV
jgi:hypothetical protein